MSSMVLAGCTGTAQPDMKFSADSPKALVVVGMEGLDRWSNKSFGLLFQGVDASGNMDRRDFDVSNGDGWVTRQSTEYYVMEVEPGAYVINLTLTDAGFQGRMYARYCKGTLKFDAPAGKAVYIGNFATPVGLGAAERVMPQFDAAAKKLGEYSGIKQTLTLADVQPAPYPKSSFCD